MSESRVRVLVVEGNGYAREVIRETVERMGFHATVVDSAEAALGRFDSEQFDLLILDTQFPGMSGITLLENLRATSDVPAIFVSVEGGDSAGRVAGLSAGVDDYLPKPFAPSELMFRINAIMRRRLGPTPDADTLESAGGLSVSVTARRATMNGEPLALTDREFSMLVTLLRRPGEVVTHEMMAREAWGTDLVGSPNFIHACVSRLRAKLAAAGSDDSIHTVCGVGYRI